jgi:hypothetical protein
VRVLIVEKRGGYPPSSEVGEEPIKMSDRPGSPTCEWFIRIRKVRQNLEEEKIFRRKSSNHEDEKNSKNSPT